ncbi:uncharacterized protein C8R40DRAFT_1067891 [Lentinula edodes]|uniref:uncharacterized protein n=1 Tax=Lentinula edodes TaxID=5353 RepID=UPI001E8E6143|nr:uncharacterized protein C8R40DRAFT_1067891 [Lentinula edodes]KAH7877739.1 hypothetical protein C8R40DRAFT_1067891 [Lentinula edodes]
MSSKVCILSSDTPRLQLLEQVVESKHEEVLQLRSEADNLRRKHSSRKQNTRAAQSDLAHLKAEHLHHLSGVDDASISIIKLQTQLLVSLGCGLADPGCIEAITAEKTEEFWSYMEKVKSSPTTTADVSRTHTEDLKSIATSSCPLEPDDISASELTALLVRQCIDLYEKAGKLPRSTGLPRQCRQLCDMARTLQ